MNTNPTISKDRFEKIDKNVLFEGEKDYKSVSFSQDVWRRLKQHKPAMISIFILIFIVLMSLFAPLMNEHDAMTQIYTNSEGESNLKHTPTLTDNNWFGTDEFGRDMWTRTWEGARVSLLIGVIAASLDVVFGIVYGVIAGYFGGRADFLMMRFIEIIVSIPNIIIVVLLILVLEPGITAIIIAIALTGWVGMARLVRGQVFSLKNREFILAARSLGTKPAKMMSMHLIPNMVGPVLVNISFTIPFAIFTEAFLSFIGLGVPVPYASLGSLISDSRNFVTTYPFLLLIPATILTLIVTSFSIFGDGLRDAVDPKLRK
ncbi:ABC transporter permease [Chengkuizengella axinellae]|uniref:ABC transporter permease n=1 Tax=Chengkuizengella axinellae TaxID=3064388 RepID=A0ABT9J1Q7_9BACL|nr:ABC transporter permease [Chengkuizengella sp. 2205SS18-9]MDP5275542.1 ABC transporter permease [Chengkuizengella sp. 2205SS18-9]